MEKLQQAEKILKVDWMTKVREIEKLKGEKIQLMAKIEQLHKGE
jgi:cell division protein FtsB